MPDLSPDDALDVFTHLARSLDRVATSGERAAATSEQTLAVVTDLAHTLRPLRWCLPLAWGCAAIALFTLVFVAWATVQLVREGREHHARMPLEHQMPRP